MKQQKKNCVSILIASTLFVFFHISVFAANIQRKKSLSTTLPRQTSAQKHTHTSIIEAKARPAVIEEEPSTQIVEEKYTMHRRADPYNGWVWAGAGFLFANEKLQKYIVNPTMDYQIGVAKSFWNITRFNFFYAGLIFDYAYSKRYLTTDSLGFSYDAFYYFSNEQLVLGYEQALGTPYISVFLEAGGALQQRYFAIRQNNTDALTDYIFDRSFGGTFNAGMNIKIVPERRVSYILRLGMNLMIGPNGNKTLNYNGQFVHANQLSYGPSVSFGVRM